MRFTMSVLILAGGLVCWQTSAHAQGRPQQAQKGLSIAQQHAAQQAQFALQKQVGLVWAQQMAAPQAQQALLGAQQNWQQRGLASPAVFANQYGLALAQQMAAPQAQAALLRAQQHGQHGLGMGKANARRMQHGMGRGRMNQAAMGGWR